MQHPPDLLKVSLFNGLNTTNSSAPQSLHPTRNMLALLTRLCLTYLTPKGRVNHQGEYQKCVPRRNGQFNFSLLPVKIVTSQTGNFSQLRNKCKNRLLKGWWGLLIMLLTCSCSAKCSYVSATPTAKWECLLVAVCEVTQNNPFRVASQGTGSRWAR